MTSIKEQIQEGQHRANEALRMIMIEVQNLDGKIAVETFCEQLKNDLDNFLRSKKENQS